MELTFEWKKSFDDKCEKVYVESLSTLIGEPGSRRLVQVAKIYEPHDWFRLFVAAQNSNVVGMLALYYEPIHGSHEGWICVHPKYRRQGVGYKILQEFEKTAFENGIRIFRADATLAYTRSQKFLYRRGYRAVGYVPMSFSFLPGESLGGAVMVWKIFDPLILEQWEKEKTEALAWEKQRWQLLERGG
jgi:ribosomal protein S18 acetylase RimI-like enzyme